MSWRHNHAAGKNIKTTAVKPEPKAKSRIETEYDNVVTAYREKYITGKYRLVLEPVPAASDKRDAA